jgi:hypothetical protein
MNRPSLHPSLVGIVALLAIAAAACAPADGTSPASSTQRDEGLEEATGRDAGAPVCDEATADVWFVSGDEAACEDARGALGTWRPTTRDAEGGLAFCTMTWFPDVAAPADVLALRTRLSAIVSAMAPACNGAVPEPAQLTEIAYLDDPSAMGTNGCDVCGTLMTNGWMKAIFPAEAKRRAFEVSMTNGVSRAFQIETTPSATAAVFRLPPPPAGVSYVPGRIAIR